MQKQDVQASRICDQLLKATEILLDTEAEELKAFKRIHLAEASSSSWTHRLPPNNASEQRPITMRQLRSDEQLRLSESSQTIAGSGNVHPEISSSAESMLGRHIGSWDSPIISPPAYLPVLREDSHAECNILAVTQLPEMAEEGELRAIFISQEGYKSLKLGS